MRRPETFPSLLGIAFIAAALQAPAQDIDAEATVDLDDWYRIELLVFVRDDIESLSAERWDPTPPLRYPDAYRHLIDPQLHDQRLLSTAAFYSEVDPLGGQRLTLPARERLLQDHSRPDSLLDDLPDPNNPGLAGPDGLLPELIAFDGAADAGDPGFAAGPAAPGQTVDDLLAEDPNNPDPAVELDPLMDPNTPLLTTPYQLLPRSTLEFRRQASSLRRRGGRVLFHGAWWSPLDEPENVLPIVLERGSDIDMEPWPELQGSIFIYRTRYLHLETDLWLNTLGEYLPEGWQIPDAPLPGNTLRAQTLRGEPVDDPWAPTEPETLVPSGDGAPMLDAAALSATAPYATESSRPVAGGAALDTRLPADPFAAMGAPDPSAAARLDPNSPAADEEAAPYPWRHAIRHQQSRRMRSEEIHYLDHPVIGVVIRIDPVSEERQPLAPVDDREFRLRHGLPLTALPQESP